MIQVFWNMFCVVGTAWARRWRYYKPLKHQDLLTQWECYVPENLNLQQHHCANLKSHTLNLMSVDFSIRPQSIQLSSSSPPPSLLLLCRCILLLLHFAVCRCILFTSWHLWYSCYLYVQWVKWQSNLYVQPRLPRWWNSVHTNRCVCRSHL